MPHPSGDFYSFYGDRTHEAGCDSRYTSQSFGFKSCLGAIAAAENKIDTIDKITERIGNSKEATKLQELTDEQRAWLLVKMVCVEDLHGQSILSEALWL